MGCPARLFDSPSRTAARVASTPGGALPRSPVGEAFRLSGMVPPPTLALDSGFRRDDSVAMAAWERQRCPMAL